MKNIIFFFLLPFSLTAQGQESLWPKIDILTAGAAASIVLHHSCGKDYKSAAKFANRVLAEEAQKTSMPEKAYQYALDAYEIKVKALWQSSSGDCESPSLRNMVSFTGFILP